MISTITLRDGDETTVLHPLQEALVDAPVLKQDSCKQRLTSRQREILALLADGVRARQIAVRLTLSEATVRNHIRAILLELGVHSQLEAVARARSLALVQDERAR
jgi:DNA-binding NarL/FixJ family response regulator